MIDLIYVILQAVGLLSISITSESVVQSVSPSTTNIITSAVSSAIQQRTSACYNISFLGSIPPVSITVKNGSATLLRHKYGHVTPGSSSTIATR